MTDMAARSIPNALRAVLASRPKFALLALLEQLGEASIRELAEAVDPPLNLNTANLHLTQLEELGWIRVEGYEQRRGASARRWVATTEPGAWQAFVDLIATAPEPTRRAA